LTENEDVHKNVLAEFKRFSQRVNLWIGHNFLGYDYPVLTSLLEGWDIENVTEHVCDTLIVSKLVDYSRENGHSIEDYGLEFGLEKIKFNDWTQWSQEMEDYCIRDVDICARIYSRFSRVIGDTSWQSALKLEHSFQLVVNSLHSNGFAFDRKRAENLLADVREKLEVLDEKILKEFPPRQVVERYFTPKLTKHGTISRTSVPRSLHGSISEYEAGKQYPLYRTVEFNPASHKQIIGVLSSAGWRPTDKTKTHIDTERDLQRIRWSRGNSEPERRGELESKLQQLALTGWKINETNLATLPDSAPSPARTLAKRILLEARRRTLTEWLGLVQDDGRIHGSFYGIGAWTHRMAHQRPNTANIPTDAKLYGKEMRSLWRAPRNRLLVGVDAEGIQLRIFAHYIDDKEFTNALVNGKKSDKSDPHSLNQRILGDVCKSRNIAKRFIFAYLLGAGVGKLSEILETDERGGQSALDRLIERYKGLQELKDTIIPADARRGWFRGLDNRKVPIPGETIGSRKHLCMSGYLQNGEAIVVKATILKAHSGILEIDKTAKLVNCVHDEVIYEVANNVIRAEEVKEHFCSCIKEVGEELKLKCPLAGDGSVGLNWFEIH
jgi:DNA polymerase-1